MKKKVMVFIDGTNLLIELGKEINSSFKAEKPPAEALNLANGMCVFR
jgi:hypothetical protein